MRLALGAAVGPYQIVSPIGAGAMGEVYRARDHRLGRDVALKVLPQVAAGDQERLRRFEQEARAAGALNHPNVAAVYDAGSHEGIPYIVSELLEGETLRARMGGARLPLRKALEIAAQVARGLAAAHDKQVVHRDLKPENLFVTRDGQAKVLDFGLAKLTGSEVAVRPQLAASALSSVDTETGTAAGTVMGTVGYMSPEQVQGLSADHRSDIFSLGVVVFEMVSGQRAFKAATAAETMTAILREDPLQAPGGSLAGLGPGLERVLRHCLEKSPDERFQSARDLAFALEALASGEESGLRAAPRPRLSAPSRRAAWLAAGALVTLGLAVLAGSQLRRPAAPPAFRQLTFRLGWAATARFTPDGQTVVYTAAYDNTPFQMYSTRSLGGGTQALGHHARVLSISASEELAILLLAPGATVGGTGVGFGFTSGGTLARVPLAAGGVPREILEDVLDADWAPDGQSLAVSRWSEERCSLEFPVGRALYGSDEAIVAVRVSPDAQRVAFLEAVAGHGQLTNSFRMGVVDRSGALVELWRGWVPTGMAWSRSGRELWFSALNQEGSTDLSGVTLDGKLRLVTRFPGYAGLADVARDGRALMVAENGRLHMYARATGEPADRSLSWHGDANVADLSSDGRTLLFNANVLGGGRDQGIYLRGTDGSPPVRLGEGFGYGLSPDGRFVLSFKLSGARLEFVLLPTRAGDPIRITDGLPASFHGAGWLPDSQGFVFSGSSSGEGARLYLQRIEATAPRPLTGPEEDLRAPLVSPDGQSVAALDGLGEIVLHALEGSRSRQVAGLEEGEIPIQWSKDGRALYVYRPNQRPVRIYRLEVEGGRRLLHEIDLVHSHEIDGNVMAVVSPDGRSYAYSFFRGQSELHLVEGLD